MLNSRTQSTSRDLESLDKEALSATASSDSETLLNEQMVQSHLEFHQRSTRSPSISTTEERADTKTPSRSVSVDSPTDAKVGLQHTQMRSLSTGTTKETNSQSSETQPRSKSVSVDLPTDDDDSALRHPQKRGSLLSPSLQGKSQEQPLTCAPSKNPETASASMSELESSAREDTKSRGFTVSEINEKVNNMIILIQCKLKRSCNFLVKVIIHYIKIHYERSQNVNFLALLIIIDLAFY